ncbi:TAFII28-domain-containing protein [Anaeromyces robustus]|uniref:Transcription initiation factor TFIID subunit 11 n=1 Tax=Anaeromyces robustus TaxID=1754192 RepID=A0A1Y1VUJ3_9FUNG|nr:TAFII28-domain-containing protein [Anaeromyces robustus]|eukprot:ORX64424.1 TAFII28-domain-containing protein [Anaeromyces robustus]
MLQDTHKEKKTKTENGPTKYKKSKEKKTKNDKQKGTSQSSNENNNNNKDNKDKKLGNKEENGENVNEKDKKEEKDKEKDKKEDEEQEDEEDQDIDGVYEELEEENTQLKNKEMLKDLLNEFSEEQIQRYEVYRRSTLPKAAVKRLVQNILNQSVSNSMGIVVGGFSKIFIGEIVEKARDVMEDWGDEGAIRPEHLREAYRLYKEERKCKYL